MRAWETLLAPYPPAPEGAVDLARSLPETLAARHVVTDMPRKLVSLTAAQQREAAEAYIPTWWNFLQFNMTEIPRDVQLVFLGAEPMHKIKEDMRLRYAIPPECPQQQQYFLFYITQSTQPDVVSVSLLGIATRSALTSGAPVLVKHLLRERQLGYAAWRANYPVAELQPNAEDGSSRETWRYPVRAEEAAVLEMHAWKRLTTKRLFLFPLRTSSWLLPDDIKCTTEAVYRRGVYFVAETGWKEAGDDERWAEWDKEAGLGRQPGPLQHPSERVFLLAYFVAALAAAMWPLYAKLRDEVEVSYFRYQMARGNFYANEAAALMLLQKNGLSDWLLELAVAPSDLELFANLFPAHQPPKLCGWVPFAQCPPCMYAHRPIRAGAVRVFYPDVQALVLYGMKRDQHHVVAHCAEYERDYVAAYPLVGDLWAHTREMIDTRLAPHGPEAQAARYGRVAIPVDITGGGSAKVDLDADALVLAMPPCMRRMVESSKNTPRNLRDGERPWFARFLLNLGYSKRMYDTLIRPHWEAETTAAGKPTGDSQWRAAWDATHVWKKEYAKPACAKIIEQTLQPRTTVVDPVTHQQVPAKRCECPYAQSVRFNNQSADIENIVQLTTRKCMDEWKANNADKARETEKPLYYPVQHIYMNLRRGKSQRAHVEIAYEQQQDDDDDDALISMLDAVEEQRAVADDDLVAMMESMEQVRDDDEAVLREMERGDVPVVGTAKRRLVFVTK